MTSQIKSTINLKLIHLKPKPGLPVTPQKYLHTGHKEPTKFPEISFNLCSCAYMTPIMTSNSKNESMVTMQRPKYRALSVDGLYLLQVLFPI